MLFGILIFLHSCFPSVQGEDLDISAVSASILPEDKEIIFADSLGNLYHLDLERKTNYYENVDAGSESYGYSFRREERAERIYRGDSLQISYKIRATIPYNTPIEDKLELEISNDNLGYVQIQNFSRIQNNDTILWTGFQKRPELNFVGNKFIDVYYWKFNTTTLIFKKHMGLIGFRIKGYAYYLVP